MSNRFYEPLYSRDGGPPRAFECLMESTEPDHRPGKRCGHVCKTARGMEGHLNIVHALRIQITLDEAIAASGAAEQSIGEGVRTDAERDSA